MEQLLIFKQYFYFGVYLFCTFAISRYL